MKLSSDLWLDQPDAHDQIAHRQNAGTIREDQAELLRKFVEQGFLRVQLDLADETIDRFALEIDQLWDTRPFDVAVSVPGFDPPTSLADYDGDRRPFGYRIPDLHGRSSAARELYLHRQLFELIDLIFDQPGVAFQSLYFEFGSGQELHRDPMFVRTSPHAHLLASWIALEDVVPASGPLEYVPGSHTMPWFEFEPGSIVWNPSVDLERTVAWKFGLAELQTETPPVPLIARKGEAFIWHGGLLHGGAPVVDPSLTRKSFVVHYSTAANYLRRSASMRIRSKESWRSWQCETDEIISTEFGRGLTSPFVGKTAPEPSAPG